MEHSQALDLVSWSSEELGGSGLGYSQDVQADAQPCLGLQLFTVKVVWTGPLQSKFRRELGGKVL